MSIEKRLLERSTCMQAFLVCQVPEASQHHPSLPLSNNQLQSETLPFAKQSSLRAALKSYEQRFILYIYVKIWIQKTSLA